MKRIIYVSHDQLNTKYGALKDSNPKDDLIVLVESARMVSGDHWNRCAFISYFPALLILLNHYKMMAIQ